MAVVRSEGQLTELARVWTPSVTYGSLRMYDQYNYDYATLYRTQPNVRTCVDFLARNVAQLGLHVYRRVSETDRAREREHPLALLLKRPMPPEYKVSTYRLIEGVMSDLGVYFNAYLWKVRGGGAPVALFRLPPTVVKAKGGLVVSGYEVNLGGTMVELRPEDVVHFHGYNPESLTAGLSPLETLRRVLAEEYAMGQYREGFWQNSARMSGVIQRPLEAPEWSQAARERFRADVERLYTGAANSGTTAILEEGMEWKDISFNAQESEYLAGRKLTREECARAYHIPLPMVGILDHATYSNVKEQHKHLYQDCLGPWLAMIEQDIELQLLEDFPESEGVYVEFNIAEKLQGSFEEQTQAFSTAVGRPYMTADEARGKLNLPSLGGDAAELVTPLNVLAGGQASPRDSAPPKDLEEIGVKQTAPMALKQAEVDATLAPLRERHERRWLQYLERYFTRQRNSLIGRVAPLAIIEDVWLDGDRWNTELAADLYRLNTMTARSWGSQVADLLDIEFDDAFLDDYLATNARVAAESINRATRDEVAAVLGREDPKAEVSAVYERAVEVRAPEIAETHVTNAANFGAQEGARQGGLKGKRWKVNSSNPREQHIAMNGETVGIRDVFSNGLRWPGDPQGGAAETAHCKCSLEFVRQLAEG